MESNIQPQNPLPQRVFSSGSLKLDHALQIGGFPGGYLIEINGEPESGKTTLCQHSLVQAQQEGAQCAWIDADHTFHPQYAEHCGVGLNQLVLAEPDSIEQALETASILVRSGAFGVIVIDCLSNLPSQVELANPLGTTLEDVSDALTANWLPRLATDLLRNQTTLILTTPASSSMSGVYHGLGSHLNRLALPLHAAIRIKLSPDRLFAESPELRRIRVEIVKNKFAPCFKSIDLDIIVNTGIDKTGELFDLSDEFALLSRRDHGIYYGDRYLGKNRSEAIEILSSDGSLSEEIEQAVRRRMHI
jgi:recombination protein RecA